MSALTASVGRKGENLKQDVVRVQILLKTAGIDPGPNDGVCGRLTIEAIKKFQETFLPFPDGLIMPEGPTWRKLAELQQKAVDEEA
jgi:peptidoglycan hydrolase-like protein with peptidoglycan-binding domain